LLNSSYDWIFFVFDPITDVFLFDDYGLFS